MRFSGEKHTKKILLIKGIKYLKPHFCFKRTDLKKSNALKIIKTVCFPVKTRFLTRFYGNFYKYKNQTAPFFITAFAPALFANFAISTSSSVVNFLL